MVAQKASRRLTPKEEEFARLVAGGATLTDAYRKAYNSNSPNARINALRVSRRAPVLARIKELQTPDEKRLFLTRARKREILLGMAENLRATYLDRQRAIAIDNKMTGDDRLIVHVEGEITLSAVLAAMQGAPALPPADDSFEVEASPISDSSPGTKGESHTTATQPAQETGAVEVETTAPAPRGPYDDEFTPAFDEPPAPVDPPKKRSRSYD